MITRNNPFGVLAFLNWNHEWNRWHFDKSILERALKQLQELGVSFVRTDILWSDIHRGDRQYDFSAYDQLIKEIRRHGLDVLALLQYNKVKDGPDGELWNRPPDSFEEFAEFVGAAVTRYKNDIKHWEIWNEPNHPMYWSAPPDNLKTYSRLLGLSYESAKKADPSCRVLNGGLTEPVLTDVKNLYGNGGKIMTDILSIHTFVDPHSPKRAEHFQDILNGVKKILESNNDGDKKVWITEMGCPGVPKDVPPQKWFAGESVDEETQAAWLDEMYHLIKPYPFIEKLFWAFYRDTDKMFNEATDYFGLVRFDLTPKPAFYRMQQLIKDSVVILSRRRRIS